MTFAFLARTLIAGGYLLAVVLNGRFDAVTVLLVAAVSAVWAAPLARDAWCRRHACAENERLAHRPAH
jgi:hypothetical protein